MLPDATSGPAEGAAITTTTGTLTSRPDTVGRAPSSPPRPAPMPAQGMVLDASADAIVAVNANGEVVFANRAVKRVFGWSPGELVGLSVEQLVPVPLGERHVESRRAFLTAPENRPMGIGLDLTARHREGREFPVEVGLTNVETAEGPLVFATIVDISARKALTSQLEQTSEELRQHVVVCRFGGEEFVDHPPQGRAGGHAASDRWPPAAAGRAGHGHVGICTARGNAVVRRGRLPGARRQPRPAPEGCRRSALPRQGCGSGSGGRRRSPASQ